MCRHVDGPARSGNRRSRMMCGAPSEGDRHQLNQASGRNCKAIIMSEMDFIIRAALSDDMNEGWVWIQTPSNESLDAQLEPRRIVRINRRSPRRSVYVELRRIDRNFRENYNEERRLRIVPQRDTLIMAEWYRDALGISETTHKDNETGTVRLCVGACRFRAWCSIRAACHHPDIIVRLGTRLGLCGVWLGLLGAFLGASSVRVLGCIPFLNEILAAVVFISGIVGLLASRGPAR